MKKNFDEWNEKKKNVHTDKERPFFRIQEIWFCHLGVNIGFEQDGAHEEYLRPVVILKKFNNQVCWILPLTRSKKRGDFYLPVRFKGDENSVAILSQIRFIDAKRLKYKGGYLSRTDFDQIKKRLKDFLS